MWEGRWTVACFAPCFCEDTPFRWFIRIRFGPLPLAAGLSYDRSQRGLLAHAVRFGFERVVLYDGDSAAEGVLDAPRLLLHDVPEFVAENLLSLQGVRVVVAWGEMYVRAPSVGDCADARSLVADVYAHVREVRAEGRLHLRAHFRGQGLPARLRLKGDAEGVHAGRALALNRVRRVALHAAEALSRGARLSRALLGRVHRDEARVQGARAADDVGLYRAAAARARAPDVGGDNRLRLLRLRLRRRRVSL